MGEILPYKLSRRIVICLMTMLVMGYSLGSLVNFHLNRIYGNPLETDILFVKKEEKVSAKDLLFTPELSFDGVYNDLITIPECSVIELFVIGLAEHTSSLSALYYTGDGLRAPPIV